MTIDNKKDFFPKKTPQNIEINTLLPMKKIMQTYHIKKKRKNSAKKKVSHLTFRHYV
jgi:hypothetical protein